MPTYEYICEKCGHEFEVFQSMNDEHLKDCPKKGCAGPVKRAIGGGAGLIFKGSGFYITDYRSDNYKSGAKKDKEGSKSSSSSSSSSKSTAKSASKKSSKKKT